MKKFLLLLSVSVIGVLAGAGVASATPRYCGTSAYDLHYQSIYNYPTGSYWVNQIAHYPDYYAAHNAQFQARFGC